MLYQVVKCIEFRHWNVQQNSYELQGSVSVRFLFVSLPFLCLYFIENSHFLFVILLSIFFLLIPLNWSVCRFISSIESKEQLSTLNICSVWNMAMYRYRREYFLFIWILWYWESNEMQTQDSVSFHGQTTRMSADRSLVRISMVCIVCLFVCTVSLSFVIDKKRGKRITERQCTHCIVLC